MNETETFLISAVLKGDDKYRNTIFQEAKPEWFLDDYARELFTMAKFTYLDLPFEFNPKLNAKKLLDLEESISYEYISGATFGHYLAILKENFKKHLVKKAKEELNNIEDEKKYREVMIFYNKKLQDLEITEVHTKAFKDNMFDDFVGDYIQGFEKMLTGYKALDNIIGGFYKQESTIIAGASSMGKSAVLMNIAKNIARQNKKVLIFSLEMSKLQLFNRLLCSEADVNLSKIRKRELNDDDISCLKNAYDVNVRDLPIVICDKANLNLIDINAMVKEYKPDIAFIDYLGLIKPLKASRKYEEVSEISRDIKLLAKENNIPVVTLCQISRMSDDRKNKRPTLKDLKDSGSIENDADNVIGIYRDEYYNPDTIDRGKIEIAVLKQRQGAWGSLKLNFNAPVQRITE